MRSNNTLSTFDQVQTETGEYLEKELERGSKTEEGAKAEIDSLIRSALESDAHSSLRHTSSGMVVRHGLTQKDISMRDLKDLEDAALAVVDSELRNLRRDLDRLESLQASDAGAEISKNDIRADIAAAQARREIVSQEYAKKYAEAEVELMSTEEIGGGEASGKRSLRWRSRLAEKLRLM